MNGIYKVKEIFYSLQGEGFHSGTPVVFIRFSGCNLKCEFCDTDFSGGQDMTASEIVAEVIKYPTRHVVCTGGEPTLQLDAPLIGLLKMNHKIIHMESNGVENLDWEIDWVTISPKEEWNVKQGDELKVVYTGQDLEPYFKSRFNHYFLQPCSEMNTKEVIEICLKDPRWRLSLQTHKMIDIK